MKLTDETKRLIDELSYFELLAGWRCAPDHWPWMEGETAEYWKKTLIEWNARGNGLTRESWNVGRGLFAWRRALARWPALKACDVLVKRRQESNMRRSEW